MFCLRLLTARRYVIRPHGGRCGVRHGVRARGFRQCGVGQRGLTLLEGLLSVGVIAAGLAIITTMQLNQISYEKAAVAAQQHRIVHYAARRYVRDKFGELLAEVAAGGMTEIAPGRLVEGGYLPDFMIQNGVLRVNPYEQSYRLLVRRTDSGHDTAPTLELLTVTDGGKKLGPAEVGRIVSITGAEAGSLSLDHGSLLGAYGSWEINMADLPAQYRLQPGNMAMIAYYRQGRGVFVNAYAVNLPSREDEYEDLPERDQSRLFGTAGGVDSLIREQRERTRQATSSSRRPSNRTRDRLSSVDQRIAERQQWLDQRYERLTLGAPVPSSQAAPQPASQPAAQPAPRPAPAPVTSDNTRASAGAACAPDNSLAISLDNRNQTLVCQSQVWQPVNLPLALHYAGLSETAPVVSSKPFTLRQRAFLVADAAIGPIQGQTGINLPSTAGIKVNGYDCPNSAAGRTGTGDGVYRCTQVLEPGQYVISASDGIGGDTRRAYNRLSFVVLPH